MDNFDLDKINFGIEIEFTGINRLTAASLISGYFKTTCTRKIQTFEIESMNGSIWRLVRDSSIGPEGVQQMYSDLYKNELITPICNIADINAILDLVELLKENGGIANDSCGLHVHVGAEIHSTCSLSNMLVFWIKHQRIFTDYFKTNQSSLDKYCQYLPDKMLDFLLSSETLSEETLKSIWYEGYEERPAKYNKSRYRTMNLNTLYTIGTIEYRIGKGSLDSRYILEYLKFCLFINKKALEDKNIRYELFDSMDEIYEYLGLKIDLDHES